MVHAKLGVGADNSGKLVAYVKTKAKVMAKQYNKKYIIVDGSPGVGCPVVSSLTGAHFVVLVTEPTVSGVHDLKRVYELVNKFKIKAACIINKYDLNEQKSQEILGFLAENNILHLANLPYDEEFTKAMTNCKTIVESEKSTITPILKQAWDRIKLEIN